MKRSELRRKTPLDRSGELRRTAEPRERRHRPKVTYRQLQPGEDVPPGKPRRYPDGRGYVRLRWKTAPNQYVEVYEHRLLAGVPNDNVHHRDEDKGNNSPENLEVMSRSEHAAHHAEEARAGSRRLNEWGGLPNQAAYDKRQRRLERQANRKEFLAQVAALNGKGLSTIEIGAEVGRDPSNISRALRAAGALPAQVSRPSSGEVSNRTRQVVHTRSQMRCERCGANLVWAGGQVHHRRPRQMGGSHNPILHRPPNLLHLCVGCHRHVESNREEAYAAGWLVRQSDDPLQVPVWHWQRGLIFLDAGGGWSSRPPTAEEA